MKKKTLIKVLFVLSLLLVVSAVVFLCLSIFTEPKNNTYLCVALVNILLSNALNLIKNKVNKQ